MFREMRRGQKKISRKEAYTVLNDNEVGVLSTIGKNNYPYGTPMNYIYSDHKIYLHCAKEGHKIDNIKYNSNVCFTVIDSYQLVSDRFTSKFLSIVIFGIASFVDHQTKKDVLREYINKFSPGFKEKGFKYVDKAVQKTEIIEIEIEDIKGKKND
ncbi:MAG: pyridoxamine 5'-phosphate oxidase family protein [Halanaerobiales bacterium]|nr:pyridoxamine 5'-phosphate oxidase family protein [Halanaerobiales bacterium]